MSAQSGTFASPYAVSMVQSDPPQHSADLKNAVLICNSKSRRGKEWFPQVEEELKKRGFNLTASYALRDPDKLKPLVQKAVKEEIPLIIVGGGDGSMSSTASLLKDSKSILGVLPLGTGNAFARDLGIPSEVAGACEVLENGIVVPVDLGMIGGKHFVNVATVGLTTRIAESLTDEAKKKFGRFVYLGAIVKSLAGLRSFRATLHTDTGEHHFETMQIVFGSGRFHAGPFPVTKNAEIIDHHINGYALKGSNKSTWIKYAMHLFSGAHVELPEVEEFSFKTGRLETLPRRRFVIDGEIGERTPADLSIDPAAVRVLVSKDFPGFKPAG